MNIYDRTYQGFIQFRNYRRTWSFPAEIEHILLENTIALDKTVLHLYGGVATFGTRIDVDPIVRPDVLGNALFPPFKCKSFDVVVIDPPYEDLKSGMALQIIAPAACLARETIFWFHTHWGPGHALGLKIQRWWACSPCSLGAPTRILVEYKVTRHPLYCHAIPRRGHGNKLPLALRKYDWTAHFPNPVKRGPVPAQRRLF